MHGYTIVGTLDNALILNELKWFGAVVVLMLLCCCWWWFGLVRLCVSVCVAWWLVSCRCRRGYVPAAEEFMRCCVRTAGVDGPVELFVVAAIPSVHVTEKVSPNSVTALEAARHQLLKI